MSTVIVGTRHDCDVDVMVDYGSFFFCETCDMVVIASAWDSDARMCEGCAEYA